MTIAVSWKRARMLIAVCGLMMVPALQGLAGAPPVLIERLERLVHQPEYAGLSVGVCIATLGSEPRIIFEHHADELFVPASNQKLLTTAAAFCLLPADFCYETLLGMRGNDLVIIGSGDPSIGDPRIAQRLRQPQEAVFLRWAERLRAMGITRIEGDLLYDDFIFDQETVPKSWIGEFNEQAWYAAPVGGLNYNDNCIDVVIAPAKEVGKPALLRLIPDTPWVRLQNNTVTAKKGEPTIVRKGTGPLTIMASGPVSKANSPEDPLSIAIIDPGAFFAHTCRAVLAREGISIAGQVRREMISPPGSPLPRDLRVIDTHRQPWMDFLWRVNKSSLNMFAESLLKTLGTLTSPGQRPQQGTYARGRTMVQRVLTAMGIPEDSYVVADGSGLSRDNRVTPAAVTGILQAMDQHPMRKQWWSSLATPGEEFSTLKRRMKGLKGRVFAKTGHTGGVSSLSGYVIGPDKTMYAFSVLCNQTQKVKDGTAAAHRLQDAVCALLASGGQTTAPSEQP